MIIIEPDPRDLEHILKKLQSLGGDAPSALRNAINTTATAAKKLLVQGAQERYTVKNGGFNKHTKIKRATVAQLMAVVSAQDSPLTLPRFHTTAPKSGVKTEILRGNGLKELVNEAGNKAFKSKAPNGAAMVFQRKGKARYPLQGLYGPSVAKMVEKVYAGGRAEAGLKEELARLYRDNLQKQIDKAVSS